MLLVIKNLATGRLDTYKSRLDVPHRHLWSIDEMIREGKESIIEGETMYELRTSDEVCDKYDYRN